MGATIGYEGPSESGPLHIEGKKLRGGTVSIDPADSSQFVSSLLMIAPTLEEGLTLHLEGTVSSLPYIHMTLGVMEYFGVKHCWEDNRLVIPHQPYQSRDYVVEPDWSSASYWLEIAALASHAEIILEGIPAHSLQGDSSIVQLMVAFGVHCRTAPEGIVVTKNKNAVRKVEANFLHHPDLAPALVATAAGLQSHAAFTGLQNLNAKESKRQDVLFSELSSAGVKISSSPGKLELSGGKIKRGAEFKVHNDHRMAMALAPLCLVNGSVGIDDPAVVAKSYPGYWEDLERAGFTLEK
jgi:3-phosphoshikimate 1-carboxyvinyltransferase